MEGIRRRDRRGVTPEHILYMAMKNLRFRVRDGIQNLYRCLRTTENITRENIENREFVERLIDANQAFLKTIPNSAQYWAARKKDVFDQATWEANSVSNLECKRNTLAPSAPYFVQIVREIQIPRQRYRRKPNLRQVGPIQTSTPRRS